MCVTVTGEQPPDRFRTLGVVALVHVARCGGGGATMRVDLIKKRRGITLETLSLF